MLATSDPTKGVQYATSDHLGSPRVWTDSTGNVIAGGRHDYLAFGEELLASIPGIGRTTIQNYPYRPQDDGKRNQFTSKERDTETGLDYFGARYYASALGRFSSTDPVVVTSERFYDPQQFNLYAYTRNNPLRFVDPTGKTLTISGDIKHAQQELCDLVGGDCTRITYDAKTKTITVDLTGIDLSKNEGAALLKDLVSSTNRYDLSIGPTVETLGGRTKVERIVNLDNNPDDRYSYRKPPGKVNTEKPAPGIDDQVAINLAGLRTRVSDTNLKVSTIESIVFHELAEAYAKVEHNKQYFAAHKEAIDRESKLRDQRPYLKQHNPGSGPGDRVIIKK